MLNKVNINKYGFYELTNKPSYLEVEEYYSKIYYQESKGSYENSYTKAEVEFIKNKLAQKYKIIEDIIDLDSLSNYNFLDIGCGEGWALNFFKNKGWNTLGLDFSSFGITKFNRDSFPNFIEGDIYANVDQLIQSNKTFECIYLVNVLEHVLEPLTLLNQCYELLSNNGIILVQVPNDFSSIQQYLLSNNTIDREFWVSIPDHISYFNLDGLISIAKEAGLNYKKAISDFPIDINLFNTDTNYIMDESKGRNCHSARVEIENFLHNIANPKVDKLCETLAEIGLGRNITAFFMKD